MKRILHIIPSLDRAGAERQLVLLAGGLARDAYDVHVAALTRGGPLAAELEAAGVPVTVIGKRWKADPLAWSRLRRHVARLRPDLVHTWLFAANAYGRAAARRAGVRRIVAGERCVDRWKSGWQFAVDRRLARVTDRIVANSRAVREFGVAHGVAAEKFTIIPNGVLPAPPSPITRAELFAELGLPQGAWLIGIVGRLWPQKGVKELIWASNVVQLRHANVHVLVMGDGPQRRPLERFTRLVGSTPYVHFLGHREDVPRILPHLDVLWQGSEYEGLPNAVMEAMASGVPVVASDIGPHRDLIADGETGLLYPPGDRAGLARATDQLHEDPARTKKMGAAGRRRMETQFTVDKMVERHVELYRELLE